MKYIKLYDGINFNDIDDVVGDGGAIRGINDLSDKNEYCWFVKIVDDESYYKKLYNDLLDDLDNDEKQGLLRYLMTFLNPVDNGYMIGDKFVLYYEPVGDKWFDWFLYNGDKYSYNGSKCLGDLEEWLYG
jgi:hypothetical protein